MSSTYLIPKKLDERTEMYSQQIEVKPIVDSTEQKTSNVVNLRLNEGSTEATQNSTSPQLYKMLVDYNSQEVNALLHIDNSKELELDEHANECGKLLIQFAFQDVLAISRLHYHYKLQDKERVVVMVQDSSTSRRKDIPSTGTSIIVKLPQLPQEKDIPYIFRFDNNGMVVPLEYISGSTLEEKIARIFATRVTLVLNNIDFLNSIFKLIKEQGNIDRLGFQLNFEDEILSKTMENDVLHENNWHRYQEVTYRKLDSENNSTITSWRFSKNPKNSKCYCVNRVYCQRTGQSHMTISDGHNQYD